MPTFTLSLSAGEGARLITALCARAGLPPTQANAQQTLRAYLIQTVLAYEQSAAMGTAIAAVVEPGPINPT